MIDRNKERKEEKEVATDLAESVNQVVADIELEELKAAIAESKQRLFVTSKSARVSLAKWDIVQLIESYKKKSGWLRQLSERLKFSDELDALNKFSEKLADGDLTEKSIDELFILLESQLKSKKFNDKDSNTYKVYRSLIKQIFSQVAMGPTRQFKEPIIRKILSLTVTVRRDAKRDGIESLVSDVCLMGMPTKIGKDTWLYRQLAQMVFEKNRPFHSNDYYYIFSDEYIQDVESNLYAQPTPVGGKLMAQYYKNKKNTAITFPSSPSVESFLEDIAQIEMARKRAKSHAEYREVFLVNFGYRPDVLCVPHCTPIFYLKEGESEGIFIADPLFAHITVLPILNIPIYALKDKYQVDLYSCHTIGFFWGCIATELNPQTGKYHIPGLLSLLKKFGGERLPDEFLITSQISTFVSKYREEKHGKIIHTGKHGKEDLDAKRARYTDKDATVIKRFPPKKLKADVSNFLRKKSLKYARMIQIIFYINLLSELEPGLWNERVRLIFISLDKRKFPTAKQVDMYEFAKEFLAKLKIFAKSIGDKEQKIPQGTVAPSDQSGDEFLDQKQLTSDQSTGPVPPSRSNNNNSLVSGDLDSYSLKQLIASHGFLKRSKSLPTLPTGNSKIEQKPVRSTSFSN